MNKRILRRLNNVIEKIDILTMEIQDKDTIGNYINEDKFKLLTVQYDLLIIKYENLQIRYNNELKDLQSKLDIANQRIETNYYLDNYNDKDFWEIEKDKYLEKIKQQAENNWFNVREYLERHIEHKDNYEEIKEEIDNTYNVEVCNQWSMEYAEHETIQGEKEKQRFLKEKVEKEFLEEVKIRQQQKIDEEKRLKKIEEEEDMKRKIQVTNIISGNDELQKKENERKEKIKLLIANFEKKMQEKQDLKLSREISDEQWGNVCPCDDCNPDSESEDENDYELEKLIEEEKEKQIEEEKEKQRKAEELRDAEDCRKMREAQAAWARHKIESRIFTKNKRKLENKARRQREAEEAKNCP
ncbi:MAG: hypothetical protein ACLPWD_06585 [Methanobacterium sp.]